MRTNKPYLCHVAPLRRGRLSPLWAFLLPVLAFGAPAWEPIAQLPSPLGGFATGVVDGGIVIAGGSNWVAGEKQWTAGTWIYDPALDRWRAGPALAEPVANAAFAESGGRLWITGGNNRTTIPTRLQCITPLGVDRGAGVAPPVTSAGAAAADGKLYLLGGTPQADRLDLADSDFCVVNLSDFRVSHLPRHPESRLVLPTLVTCGGRILCFGGARWDSTLQDVVNVGSVWEFTEGSWRKLTPLPIANRGLAAIALDDRHVLLAGGFDAVEGFTAATYLFDLTTEEYAARTPLPYAALVGLVQLDGWVYCLGGEDRKQHRTAAAFRLPTSAFLKGR